MTRPEAQLGLATTRELLEEVKARGETTKFSYPAMGRKGDALANVARFILAGLPAEILDYKTAGHD